MLDIFGVGIAQWLERRTRDWKVVGSNPCWSGRIIFFSRVDFLCWLLFQYLFHPRVTTVARKRFQSFCQKCRWQVTAKTRIHLTYVALHEVTWCMVVWCTQNLHRDSCSFMWHQPCKRCKNTTSVDIQKTHYKASHSCRTTRKRSESAQESREWRYISDHQKTIIS